MKTILTVRNMQSVQHEISESITRVGGVEGILVVFDIDGVILEMSPFLKYFIAKGYFQELLDINAPYNKIFHLENELQLQDAENIRDLFQFLLANYIESIALTHQGFGGTLLYKDGVFEPWRMEDWRSENLRSVGIDFASSLLNRQVIQQEQKEQSQLTFDVDIVTSSMPTSMQTQTIMFKQGILFSGDENDGRIKAEKGEILMEFFKTIGYTPKTVIFIDDRLGNVQSVLDCCMREAIDCVPIHYNYSALLPSIGLSHSLYFQCEQFAKTGNILVLYDHSSEEYRMSRENYMAHKSLSSLEEDMAGMLNVGVQTMIRMGAEYRQLTIVVAKSSAMVEQEKALHELQELYREALVREMVVESNIFKRALMLKKLFDEDILHLPQLPDILWFEIAKYEGGMESSLLGLDEIY